MKHLNPLFTVLVLSIMSILLLYFPTNIKANQAYLLLQGGDGEIRVGDFNLAAHVSKPNKAYPSKKTGGFAYRIAVGYLFSITPKLEVGPEIGYLRYRKSEYAYTVSDPNGNLLHSYDYTYTGYTRDVLLSARYAITPHFYGIGKIGVADVTQDFAFKSDGQQQPKKRATKFLPEFAFGVGYNINRYIGITGMISNTLGGKKSIEQTTSAGLQSVANISTIMLGLRLSFP